jgi:anti-sigma B factor antagonist
MLEIEIIRDHDMTIARPKGRIDSATAPDFDKAVMPLVNGGETIVGLDFQDVTFLSSTGLRTLVMAAKILKGRGQRLSITSIQAAVFQVLTISGVTSFIDAKQA